MPFPNNPLEAALYQAATEPAARPGFYRCLMASDVFIIGRTDHPGDGSKTLEAGAKLAIAHMEKPDGTPFIPFFSSLEALSQVLREEAGYVSMPARDLLEMTRGATLILNPGLDYGKEFFANETEALLATGMNHATTERIVQQATKVLLGQPANPPSDMLASLSKLLAKHPDIQAAYLCLMSDAGASAAPVLVVGLEGEGDITAAMKEAGAVAADTAPRGEPVDFVLVRRGEGGIAGYFLESVEPFYRRA